MSHIDNSIEDNLFIKGEGPNGMTLEREANTEEEF